MTPKKKPLTTVYVAFCQVCSEPINASRDRSQALRSSSYCRCASGVNSDGPNKPGVARYQHAPAVQRSPRKRRKAWKR